MKKKIIAMCATVAIAAVAVGGTLAYFTAEDSETNTFTVGNVAIDLTEPGWEAAGEEEAKGAYPGEPLAKDPTVENTGDNPCFVRIEVTNLDQFGNKGDIQYRTDYVLGKLGENWALHTDGYFYYTKVLPEGETTDALFDQIVMPTGLEGNEATEDIVVTAQAVQAQGAKPAFADVEKMTVEEIAAWFKTCGM